MSDDDCDIFNMPTKRPDANKLFMSNQELKQTDYDFIEVNTIIKKPTKVTKLKPVAAEKPSENKSRKPQKSKKQDEQQEVAVESSPKKPSLAPPTRDLSPVSQMLLERDRTKPPPSNDDALEALPVARRTRAGRRSLNPPPPPAEEPVATAPAPAPKKRASRGRKQATAAPATTTTAAPATTTTARTTTIPDMFLAGSRGNRRQVAEIAARSQVVDTIDMVTAVVPPIEGFVNLDSDDENSPPVQMEDNKETANKFDEDNPEIDINISWLGEIQMYKLRQYQKFAHMFKEVSQRNNVPVENVVINMDANFIKPNQTPLDVGLKIFHILSGCEIASNGSKQVEQTTEVDLYRKPKKFQLKVQGNRWKRPLIILMKKTETFKVLYIKCAEEMECNSDDFKLFFDGELLDPDDTPMNQDMEGNEMIDFCQK